MNRLNVLKLVVAVIAIIAAGVFAFTPLLRCVKLGMDLKGGVNVVLQAQQRPGSSITNDDMRQLIAVMRQRVDELGISEPIIQLVGKDRVLVALAGVNDPEQAVEIIGKTARLEFKTAEGQVVLDGKDLKTAQPSRDPNTNAPEINLEFNAQGSKKFAEATAKLVQQYPEIGGKKDPRRTISIYLDEEILTNPYVEEAITQGQARITGSYSFDEAANLAALLRGGALPVDVSIAEKRTVGPYLGSDSLQKSQLAVTIGLVAIMLFMLLLYRLPGLVANLSLIVYALIVLGILVALKATLTLPGIAGLLLSVGMAVDANILIYERLKEELRLGKTLWAALDAGFHHAFRTILDSNLTTLIAAVVLYFLGTGPIRGFAVTLSIGILTSMFTAITLTRYLLRLVVRVEVFRNTKLYGV
jgi:preprotein translocase subunit SecD